VSMKPYVALSNLPCHPITTTKTTGVVSTNDVVWS